MKTLAITLAALSLLIATTTPVTGQSIHVSPSNGSPHFTYHLSSQTINGGTINVSLNWAGNVTQTQYLSFHRDPIEFSIPLAHRSYWKTRNRSHGMWLISVNGIAVQSFSNPQDFWNINNTSGHPLPAVNDMHIPWITEGLDVTNTTNYINQDDNQQDRIVILTASGGKIELLNQYRFKDIADLSLNANAAYTGKYYLNAVNSVAHAIVEYDDRYFPTLYQNHLTSNIHTDGRPFDEWRPRLVRYYPGDGLEYRFREYVTPFGPLQQNSERLSVNGKRHVPIKTMYLESIYKEGQALVSFDWGKHKPNDEYYDISRGRSALLGFEGHRFSYGHNLVTLEVHGKTHQVILDALETMNPSEPPNPFIWDWTYDNFNTLHLNSDWLKTVRYIWEITDAYRNTVREIITPGNGRVKFQYLPRLGYASDGNGATSYDAFALYSIETPAGREELRYYSESTASHGPTQAQNVRYGRIEPDYSNVVINHTVKKPNGEKLFNDNFIYSNFAGTIEGSSYSLSTENIRTYYEEDGTTVDRTQSSKWYWKNLELTPLYEVTATEIATPKVFHQNLVHSIDVVGDVTTKTKYGYATPPSQSIFVRPLAWTETWVTDGLPASTPPTLQLDRTEYSYSYETMNDVFDVVAVKDNFRTVLSARTTTTRVPNMNPYVTFGSTTEYYRNIGYAESPNVSIKDTIIDYGSSLRKQREEFSLNGLKSSTQYITAPSATTRTVYHAPWIGLVKEIQNYDNLGRYVGGATFDHAGSYTGNQTNGPFTPRGALESIDIYGESTDHQRANAPVISDVVSMDYKDGGHFRSTITSITDVSGAKVKLDYSAGSVSGKRIGSEQATMSDLAVENLDLSATQAFKVIAENRVFDPYHNDPTALTPSIARSYTASSTSTADGLNNYSVNSNGYLSSGRTITDSTTSYGFGPGSFEADWRITGHTIPLWKSKTVVDYTRHFWNTSTSSNDVVQGTKTLQDRLFACLNRDIMAPDIGLITLPHYENWSSHIELTYVASDNDAIHKEASVDKAIMRLHFTDVFCDPSVNTAIDFTVKFMRGTTSYGSLSFVGDADESASRNADSTIYAQLDINIPAAALSEMKTMLHGEEMKILIEIDPGESNNVPIIELANQATDAMPTIWTFKAGTGGSPDQMVDGSLKDFSMKTEFDPLSLESRMLAKVDDAATTGNTTFAKSNALIADGRYVASVGDILPDDMMTQQGVVDGDPFVDPATDKVKSYVESDGRVSKVKHPVGVSPSTSEVQITSNVVHGVSRTTTNADGTSALSETHINTPAHFNIFAPDDAAYMGVCIETKRTDEEGNLVRSYSDVFGRTLKTIVEVDANPANNLVTKYSYDVQSRLVSTTNPIGQTISYTYDDFGRTSAITHPDLGTTKYAYDIAGRVRFTQSAQQAIDGYVTYRQYDDLGRENVVGEARLTETVTFDQLDPNSVNDEFDTRYPGQNYSGSVTASVWQQSGTLGFSFDVSGPVIIDACGPPKPEYAPPFDYEFDPAGLKLQRIADVYPHPAEPSLTQATKDNFEDLETHPSFGRVVRAFDNLPVHQGPLAPPAVWFSSIWQQMPSRAILAAFMPTTEGVRNTQGRLAAEAYRDHGAQPWWYKIYSYDEHGRVEAVVRINENLPYDATYYEYDNAGNVTVVRSVDPIRNHATWYSYDNRGRLANVSSDLSAEGAAYGLNIDVLSLTPPATYGYAHITNNNNWVARPSTPDVTYTYDRLGRIHTKTYHNVDQVSRVLKTTYELGVRGQLLEHKTEEIAPSPQLIYRDHSIVRDHTLKITQHVLYPLTTADTYEYDKAGRLISNDATKAPAESQWQLNKSSVRSQASEKQGAVVAGYNYPAGNTSNQVQSVTSTGFIPDEPVVTQTHDADGRLITRQTNDAAIAPPHIPENPSETMHWSYHSRLLALNTNFNTLLQTRCLPANQPWPATYSPNENEWTYRYNTQGLREQKRLMRSPQHDSASCVGIMPWTYYVRGLSGKELVVYQGRQIKREIEGDLSCTTIGNYNQRLVYLYPVEYRAYGATGVEIMWVRDDNGNLKKHFVNTDARGSIVGLHRLADIQTTYHPFGYPTDVTGNYNDDWKNRTGWLDRETDHESAVGNKTLSMMDLNARKYIPRHGQFATVDELWPLYASASPYHYNYHDPINWVDPSGYGGEKNGAGATISNPLVPKPKPAPWFPRRRIFAVVEQEPHTIPDMQPVETREDALPQWKGVPFLTPDMMTQTPWVDVAKTQIGQREIKGPKQNPHITEYFRTTRFSKKAEDDKTPWCGAFVAWCINNSGAPEYDEPNAVPERAESWLDYGVKVNTEKPPYGSIAVIKKDGQSHVGFVLSRSEHTITLLGGNQGNQVSIRTFTLSASEHRILGIVYPEGWVPGYNYWFVKGAQNGGSTR